MKRFLPVCFAIVFALPVLLFTASCKKEQPVLPTKALSLSQTSKSLNNSAQDTEFKIIAKADWTLTVKADGADWIHPAADDMSGKKGTTITVNLSVDANDADDAPSRKGTIEITAKGEEDAPYTFIVSQRGVNTLTGVNLWMYEELCKWYYWDGVMTATTPPDNSLSPEDFLAALVDEAYKNGAKDTSESPATIDGSWVYTGSGYVREPGGYSYISETGPNTRADGDLETIFGFAVAMPPIWWEGDLPNITVALMVSSVVPDSPADKAGLKRGMIITKFNGSDITATVNNGIITDGSYYDFVYRLYYLEGGNSMSVTEFNIDTGNDKKTYNLTAAPTKNTPILYHDVIKRSGKKSVAYLVYNKFEQGAKESSRDEWGEYDKELRTIFGKFKSEGAQEIVLDLRYNGGGAVLSSQLLSSLAGNVNTSQIFAMLKFNENVAASEKFDNPEVWRFLDEPNSLNLNKIYVLVTDYSASSSELVVNSLRGIDKQVILIGTQTEGKNVGMIIDEETIDGVAYEFAPISFKNLNAKDFCDFAAGFEPDYEKDELYNLSYGNGVVYDFGNTNEWLLKAALEHIDTGKVTADPPIPASRATVLKPALGKMKDRRKTGMILTKPPTPRSEK